MSNSGQSELSKVQAEVASIKNWIVAHAGLTLAIIVGLVIFKLL